MAKQPELTKVEGGYQIEVNTVAVGPVIHRVEEADAVFRWFKAALPDLTLKKRRALVSTAPTQILWEVYRVESERVHGVPPVHAGGLTAGMLSTLTKSYGVERSAELIKFYLTQSKPHYMQRKHDLKTLITESHSLMMEMQGAKSVTNTEARRQDLYQTNVNVMKRRLERRQ